MLNLLRAERMKLKRSPVWLAFFLMPVLPAVLGTLNYLNNLELLKDEWYSLWTQHTLFTCYFFMPATVGVYCAYIMRIEHQNHNWNKVLSMPYNRADVFLAKLLTVFGVLFFTEAWIGILYVASGYAVGFAQPPLGDLVRWCLFGTLGGGVMAAVQLLISMYMKSFAAAVGVAFAGGLSGLFFLAKNLGHIWPYSLMAYGMNSNAKQQLTGAGYAGFALLAAAYIALATGAGVVLVRRKDIAA